MTFDLVDPLPDILLELRAATDVAAIAGANPTTSTVRVRGFEPAADRSASGGYDGDVHDPFRAYVLLIQLGGPRQRTVPVIETRINCRCYGRTVEEARDLYLACSTAVHGRGIRVRQASGVGIWNSWDETGGQPSKDPDTRQPYYDFTIRLIAASQAVA